jgi:hypothetical protein
MNKELVIAAYNEDYSWISNVNSDVKITVYRKGEYNNLDGEIKLEPNVGRDVHTFFKHICLNYNNLSDMIFFSQDYPFDHVENYIDIINGNIKSCQDNSIVNVGGYYGYHWNSVTVPTPRAGIMHTLLPSSHFNENGKVLKCYSNGLPHDLNPNINVNNVWSEIFATPYPPYYEFVPGGHFSITKEQILLRSLQFYEKILFLLESNETMPWNIERLECYIFDNKIKTKL